MVGVALGVAVVVSVDLAVQSAREAFRISAETVAGRATHRVRGGPGGVPEDVYAALRLEAGVRSAAPLVEEYVSSPRLPGRALRLMGVDPFAEQAVRPYLAGGGRGPEMSPLLTAPGTAFLAASTAEDAGLRPGDTIPVEVAGERHALVLAGTLDPVDELSRRGVRDLLVVDVSLAQSLLGRRGRLSRIDLALPAGATGEAALERVRAVLPPGLTLEPAGTRSRTFAEMIRAFDLNLTALSLLALVFGLFLIYNTVTFSVVQRRRQLGTLRALGVERREVLRLLLGEAAVLGAVGTAAGLGLGVLLGRGLVRLVTRTINDLYFVVSVEGLSLPPGPLVKAAVLGVAATMLAALPAALEAVSTPPRVTLTRSYVEERARALVPRAAVAGGLLVGAGGAILLVPSRSVVLGFVSLAGVVLGVALLAPLATVLLVRAAAPLAGRALGILGTMAARGVVTALSRTAPAMAALVVAVSVTVGLGAMISSFRSTVGVWLDATLESDVYVSLPGPGSSRPTGTLDPEVVGRIAGVEGVAGVRRFRGAEAPTAHGEVRILGVEVGAGKDAGFQLAEGGPDEAADALRSGSGVLISEPLAYRTGLGVGSTLRLESVRGTEELAVRGVFHDYGSDRGVVAVGLDAYRQMWADSGVTSLALAVRESVSVDSVVGRVQRAAAEGASLAVRSNRALRERSLEVFDRTFAITGVLRLLAFVVAFIGILGALMALQLERARELGVLRANGLTPGQVWKLVTAQTGLLGLVAGLLALPAGGVLAVIMVRVVNRRSFGWTVQLDLGWALVAQTLILALAGALLAGLYPAWKMARTPPAAALREE